MYLLQCQGSKLASVGAATLPLAGVFGLLLAMPTHSELMAAMVYPPEDVTVKATDVMASVVLRMTPSQNTIDRNVRKLWTMTPAERIVFCSRIAHRWPRLWECVYEKELYIKKNKKMRAEMNKKTYKKPKSTTARQRKKRSTRKRTRSSRT